MQAALVELADLPGWRDADHEQARAVLHRSANRPAPAAGDARRWFEDNFTARLNSPSGLITGYYEPELEASPTPTPRFSTPVYRLPIGPEAFLDRATIDAGGLAAKGLEIAWLEHPVDAFLMQVQGCGRLRLPDGALLRLGYAGKNNHPYRSVGAEMVRQGLIGADSISARAIRDYVLANSEAGKRLLAHNPSFVYFAIRPELRPGDGPVGTLGVPLQALCSAAVDPSFLPLGRPLWIVPDEGRFGLPNLWIAQDTGGAIRGAGRCDLFIGSGSVAGDIAGALNLKAQVYGFWPRTAGR